LVVTADSEEEADKLMEELCLNITNKETKTP
jgi:hypothetical protein